MTTLTQCPDDDEDEEDEMDDEDVVYEPDYEGELPLLSGNLPLLRIVDEDTGIPDPPWGWDPDDELSIPARGHAHHHHNHPRRIPNPWMYAPGERGMMSMLLVSHSKRFSNSI